MSPEKPAKAVAHKKSTEKHGQRTKVIAIQSGLSETPEPADPLMQPGSHRQAETAHHPETPGQPGRFDQPQPSGPEDQSPLLKVTHQQPEGTFQLGVQIPHAAHEVLKNTPAASAHTHQKHQQHPSQISSTANHKARESASRLHVKIWNTLEWLATSALIFMVLFFIVNFNAYSTLFVDRLNQLRGQVQVNPVVQNLMHDAGLTQQPLPITATPDQSKKQIPYLDMEIAPPDDRIIIPRINRNVPIIKISDADLIKRDWGALETDIQNALRDGVVHYPGTAEPGENGNVVITGHSSYFSWDPGRFKDVFALLHEVIVGDTVIVYHNQKAYFYQVYGIEVVTPDKVDVLTQNGDNRLTLITCTPVGTNLKRLVVFAKPIQNPNGSSD